MLPSRYEAALYVAGRILLFWILVALTFAYGLMMWPVARLGQRVRKPRLSAREIAGRHHLSDWQ